MIERYESDKVSSIWSEENMYYNWMCVEKSACHSNPDIDSETLKEIMESMSPSIEEVHKEEEITKHDLVAFVNAWTKDMSDKAKQYVHYNLTSSDVKDTAFVIILKESIELIEHMLIPLKVGLYFKALDYKYIFQTGRTHGMLAQEKTLGLTFLNWYVELSRAFNKLETTYCSLVGKMSGPLGINKEFEREVLYKLDLDSDLVPTQVISRDLFIDVIESLARVSVCLERIALNIRLMSQSGIMEVSEGFGKGQVGSSAMPHKKNPVKSERICGLSRIMRAYVDVIYENSVLWGDRDISHSSSEKVVFENAFHLIYFMSVEMTDIINNLVIHEENLESNSNINSFYVNSEEIMNYLITNGVNRQDAHKFVKENCDDLFGFIHKVNKTFNLHFSHKEFLKIDDKRREKIKDNVDKIFGRIGGKDVKESPGGSNTEQ